ncbi:MAG: DUF2922 domain-containing protein [Dethiobacteria bacterium]|nr:DUF2922 domain-containing protein [Bacillota bacterium]HOB28570.1 DUF2922 domain-containing protein [Bacillota bacterium]HPZ40962.1 DUF2922 domain-containing protein [Bacillota bacterium]HQD52053.1 DUF2922 domain-containing protein [Bacillota bacterium]
MSRTLQMIFRNDEGRNVTISVPDARNDLQPVEVETVMTNILQRHIFNTSGGDISSLNKAQVVSRDVETLVEF